jgi:hypothetical protein
MKKTARRKILTLGEGFTTHPMRAMECFNTRAAGRSASEENVEKIEDALENQLLVKIRDRETLSHRDVQPQPHFCLQPSLQRRARQRGRRPLIWHATMLLFECALGCLLPPS